MKFNFFFHDNLSFRLIQTFKIYLTNGHAKFLSRDILYLFFDTKKSNTLLFIDSVILLCNGIK